MKSDAQTLFIKWQTYYVRNHLAEPQIQVTETIQKSPLLNVDSAIHITLEKQNLTLFPLSLTD